MEGKRFWRLWGIFISKNLQSKMAYKADFIMGILANLLLQFLGVFTLWIIFDNVNVIAGWNYYEVLFMYGLAAIPNGLSEFFLEGVWKISGQYIRKGELDRLLTRPINPLLSIIISHMEPHGLGSIFSGMTILSVAWKHLSVQCNIWNILFLLITCICGAVVYFSINLVVATVAFFVVKVSSTMVMVHHLNSFAKYPLRIYNIIVQMILTFIIPFAFTSYYPAAWILRKQDQVIGLFTPIISIVILTISYVFWRWGLKHYQSAGG